MRKFITILLLFTLFHLQAQEAKKVLLNNEYAFGLTQLQIFDSYISPFQYTGLAYNLDATHSAFYNKSDNKISWFNHNHIAYATTYNPPYSSAINYLSLSLAYGSYYHFIPIKNLTIKVGGELQVGGAIKYIPRNVNNIASADIYTSFFADAMIRYQWLFRKLTLSLQYQIQTPLLGAMFVPQMGQSYYEMYLDLPQAIKQTIVFSAPHNKQGINEQFAIDLLVNNFTLRLGMNHQYIQWHANNLSFYQQQIGGFVATIIDLQLFCGTKSNQSNSINYY